MYKYEYQEQLKHFCLVQRNIHFYAYVGIRHGKHPGQRTGKMAAEYVRIVSLLLAHIPIESATVTVK